MFQTPNPQPSSLNTQLPQTRPIINNLLPLLVFNSNHLRLHKSISNNNKDSSTITTNNNSPIDKMMCSNRSNKTMTASNQFTKTDVTLPMKDETTKSRTELKEEVDVLARTKIGEKREREEIMVEEEIMGVEETTITGRKNEEEDVEPIITIKPGSRSQI